MLEKNLEPILIISSTFRSLIYLKYFKKNNLLPKKIIFLKDKKESVINKKILSIFLKNKKIEPKTFKTKMINSLQVVNYIKKLKEKLFIVSLYAGAIGIIKNKMLLQKKLFLHSHPGKLPYYKGSTTIYYSLIKEKKIFCDTFFLNKKIDDGQIIVSKKYSIPKKIIKIDKEYDAKIRALNLIQAIKLLRDKKIKFKKIKKKKNNTSSYYYIIHPVLRFLALNKFKNV